MKLKIFIKKLEERAKFENREVSFQMTVDDIYAVSNGVLVGRKDGNKNENKRCFVY